MDEAAYALPPRFDASDPAVRANPYPAYARLRDAAPLCRGGPGQWVVARYADVAAMLSDPRLRNHFPADYHRFSAGDGPAGVFLQRIVLHQDNPRHRQLRRVLARSLDPGALRDLRVRIGELVDRLLEPARERGALEVVQELARPLPLMVVSEILGIPPDDGLELLPKICDLGRAFAPSVDAGSRAAADDAVFSLRVYMAERFEHRRREPGADLLTRMMAAESSGGDPGPTREELVDNAIFLFFAGFETTTSLISTSCAALLEHPDQMAILREDPSVIPTAVEEFLRYDAPIQSRLRLVAEPVEIGGRTISPGRLLLLLVGSANHDERRFADPERLDVRRDPNPHLSFGGGAHYCLGSGLARMESVIALERLLQTFRHLEPAGEPERDVASPFRTYARVPMAARPA